MKISEELKLIVKEVFHKDVTGVNIIIIKKDNVRRYVNGGQTSSMITALEMTKQQLIQGLLDD